MFSSTTPGHCCGSFGSCMLGVVPPWIGLVSAHPTDGQLDLDVGYSEDWSMSWALCCDLVAVPEQFM